MQLEDYFDFLSPDDIRIKGQRSAPLRERIGIDNVLECYLNGYSPNEIAANFPGLSLEKIYATLTYYYHKRSEIDAYLLRLRRWKEEEYQKWYANPSPMALRIREIKAKREQELLDKYPEIDKK
ncbi:DUF433 domain-containing protein [Gloeothece verrucosa]|uniref:DUF433 domain-containing protein n=1 Tax=Gloeothece verrucosa (strain PCC 7822) TaxID=497965 RepID=E0UJS8_GLOV7|nr:DUF433 domain-containing protein [Gloeothece verrucosa]ADN13439.1 protein of unknown function DUF433 [Gloeothece verrucosa PCC 7822]